LRKNLFKRHHYSSSTIIFTKKKQYVRCIYRSQRECLLHHHATNATKNMFNFNISLIEKDITSYKTLCKDNLLNGNQLMDASKETNLTVNRLYDEYNIPPKSPKCTNACKCQVDITPVIQAEDDTRENQYSTNTDSDNNEYVIYKSLRNKTRITISDCNCHAMQKSDKQQKEQISCNLHSKCDCLSTISVENRGYGELIETTDTLTNFLNNNSVSSRETEDLINSKDLLSFAKQIASGMVSMRW
jgi:hypothetical protein